MTGSAGNSEVDLKVRHWESWGNKTHCFPLGQSLSAYNEYPNGCARALVIYVHFVVVLWKAET